MNLQERYQQGLITRGEYLETTGLQDISLDTEKTRLERYAYRYHFGRMRQLAMRVSLDEEWQREELIDAIGEASNFTPAERRYHPDFSDVLHELLDTVKDLTPPVPVKEREKLTEIAS